MPPPNGARTPPALDPRVRGAGGYRATSIIAPVQHRKDFFPALFRASPEKRDLAPAAASNTWSAWSQENTGRASASAILRQDGF